MLNKTEKSVMWVVYERCKNKGSCLISLEEIQAQIKKRGIKENKIKSTLKSLELDSYFDLITCDKNGKEIFCINLLSKGYAFKRETEQQKRTLIYKILIAAVTGFITFFVGRLLFYLF